MKLATFKRSTIICYSLISIGLICFITFATIGSKVDAEGILREPFILVPIGYLCILSGILGLLIKFIVNLTNKIISKKHSQF